MNKRILIITITIVTTAIISYCWFGIRNINVVKEYGTIGDFVAGILGPLLNLFGLYYIIQTFKEQKTSSDLELKQQIEARKIHDYTVLNQILGDLIEEYTLLKPEFDKLIVYLNRDNVGRTEKIEFVKRSANSINYVIRYASIGFDIIAADIKHIDWKYILTKYRNFGETNISSFFILTRKIDIKSEELQIDLPIMIHTWANIMTIIDDKYKELLNVTINNLEKQLVHKSNSENYYAGRKANLNGRISVTDMI